MKVEKALEEMHFDMLQFEKGFVCSHRLADDTAALEHFSLFILANILFLKVTRRLVIFISILIFFKLKKKFSFLKLYCSIFLAKTFFYSIFQLICLFIYIFNNCTRIKTKNSFHFC